MYAQSKGLASHFSSKLKALFESEPAWRRSFCYQIVPNLTIFDQTRPANGREQADKGWIRGVFRDRLIKRRRQKGRRSPERGKASRGLELKTED